MYRSVSVKTAGDTLTEVHLNISVNLQEDGDVMDAIEEALIGVANELGLQFEPVE